MYARVSDIRGPSDLIDGGVANFRDNILPAIKAMSGFSRAYLLVDRESGRTLAISIWHDTEAMKASEEAATRLRNDAATDMGFTGLDVSRYEIVIAEPAG